jgi:UDP-N-acetylglucosamine/UDP-N-acetylgalactosamine diphosphorylase
MDYQALRRHLDSHGQSQLLAHWEALSEPERDALAAQIATIDLSELGRLIRTRGEIENPSTYVDRARPPQAIRLREREIAPNLNEITKLGENALRRGEVVVILVAGGQGTRLGTKSPKGMYSIGPVSAASLFQILLEKVLATGRRYGRSLPLFVMTSRATHEATEAYFAEHGYFGLDPNDVTLFEQANMPAVDAKTGKVLLADRAQLQLSPDGHGGMLAALVRRGCLREIEQRGYRYLFYMQVDNPLVEVADPLFLGYHISRESEMSTQVVAKERPEDKLGVVAQIDGRARMIEYSDLPAELAERRAPDGSLEFWAGSIAVHAFNVEFLSRAAAHAESLPFHVARKKVEWLNDGGRLMQPNRPNALKFERFIFDLMPIARNPLVYEVDRRRAFAPLKNESGAAADTPEFVRERLVELHREWLRRAGAQMDQGAVVEISPLFALDAAETARKIGAGTSISDGTYLR